MTIISSILGGFNGFGVAEPMIRNAIVATDNWSPLSHRIGAISRPAEGESGELPPSQVDEVEANLYVVHIISQSHASLDCSICNLLQTAVEADWLCRSRNCMSCYLILQGLASATPAQDGQIAETTHSYHQQIQYRVLSVLSADSGQIQVCHREFVQVSSGPSHPQGTPKIQPQDLKSKWCLP